MVVLLDEKMNSKQCRDRFVDLNVPSCSVRFHAVPTFKSQNGGFSWSCVRRFTIQHGMSRQTVQSSEDESLSDKTQKTRGS